MIVEGNFKFPNQWPDVKFTNPEMTIEPIVDRVDPNGPTINVNLTFEVIGDVTGKFAPDINPVPVDNLNYDGETLVARIIDRLDDFRVE